MLAASRHRVNAPRAYAGDAPASPHAGVITTWSGQVASGRPRRRHSQMIRSAVWRASALPSPGPVGPWTGAARRRECASRIRFGDRGNRADQQAKAGLGGLGYPVLLAPP